ncbi:MAG: trigger factor [Nitrospinae bacterium]|nr:trigger factor [Nitrospinota bacterium]
MAHAVAGMKVEINDVQPCVKQLHIEIPADHVADESAKKWKELGRHAQVPGFRKGKAPRHILEKMYAQSVLGEVGQKLISDGYEAAIHDHKIEVLGDPTFQEVKVEPGKPISFNVVVETFPQVTVSDFSGWTFEREVRAVDEKEIQSAIDSILEADAELTPVDRPANEGDYVSLDYAGSVDGKDEPKLAGKGQQMVITLAGDNLFGDFHKNLVGAKGGEEKSFTMNLSKQYPDPELAGKQVSFKVNVTAVKEKKLPELTDAFVASHTAYQTVDEMRQKLRERAEDRERERGEEDLRRKVMAKFREVVKFDLPPKMVAQYAEMYGNRVLRTTRDWGVDLRSQADFDQAKFDKNCAEKGEEWARDEVIVETIAKREKLEPDTATMDRLQKEYAEFLKAEDRNTRYNAAMYTLKEAMQESVFKYVYTKIAVADKTVAAQEKKEND